MSVSVSVREFLRELMGMIVKCKCVGNSVKRKPLPASCRTVRVQPPSRVSMYS